MRYMFIHNPHPDNPERSVSSRSGKSSIRAHITKEYHRERRLRRTIAHADKARGLASAIPATPSWLPPNLDSYVLELGKEEEEPEEQETELQTEKDTQTARDHESMTGEDNDQNTESVIGSDTDHDTDHGQPPNVEAGLDMKVPEASKASDSVRYTTTIHPVTSSLTWWSPKLLDLVELHDLTWETNRVLEHAMLQTWPMTMPAKGSGLRNPITNIWLQYAVEHPVVLHAFLYAAGIHLHLVGAQATAAVPHECFGLAHKVEAIKLIQDALLNLHTPPSEALIMAVATLAVHGKQDDGYHFPHAHPASPLSHQQYLHIYGRMIPADEHISAFRTLVRLKGGLATIKTYAMAETLALTDIFFATREVAEPEFCDIYCDCYSLTADGEYAMDEEAVRLYTDLGAGFKYLDIMQQVCPGFLEVLEMMCEVTTALDQYSRNATGAPDIADLLKARNTVQHALLSAASRGSGSDSRRTIYEKLCRLAALIFSDMVIFPIPPAQGLKSRLAKMLQSTLERVDQEPATSIHSRLLVWITMMGAIASASTAYHCWYLQRLHSQLLQLKLTSWRDLRELCAKHLWWSPVCDVPGRSIFDIVSILGKE